MTETVDWLGPESPLAVEAREWGRKDAKERVLHSEAFKAWRDHVSRFAKVEPVAGRDPFILVSQWYQEGYEEESPGDFAKKNAVQYKLSHARDAYNFGYFLVPTDRVYGFQAWKDSLLEAYKDDENLGVLVQVVDREFKNGATDRMYRLGYKPL